MLLWFSLFQFKSFVNTNPYNQCTLMENINTVNLVNIQICIFLILHVHESCLAYYNHGYRKDIPTLGHFMFKHKQFKRFRCNVHSHSVFLTEAKQKLAIGEVVIFLVSRWEMFDSRWRQS